MSDNPFGFGARDIITGLTTGLMVLMGIIFKATNGRIKALEETKVDKVAHTSEYSEIIRRLNAQDESAIRRDEKLDRIIERILK